MSQGAEGVRPGVALPIRVHDLLLGFAGRLDDDALADARQLLASAELDRALEFLGGCLVAGRVAITNAQRQELSLLFSQVYLDPAMIDRLVVDDGAASNAVVRHRFGGGAIDGESSVQGVAEAARRVLDVLPDVRSVWAVWRLTPAGPASGPVPHRVVLVGVGPAGFAPATSYRLEYALRQSGIRASVEVLRDGAEAPDYHHAAMQYAAQVPFARQAPTNPSPVRPRDLMEPAAPSMPPPGSNPTLSTPISSLQSPASARPAPPPPPPSPPVATVPEIAPPPPPAPPEISVPGRRSRPEPPADPLASANPPVRPVPALPASWLSELPESTTPKPPPTNGKVLKPEPLPADESLSDQEKLLLRQLQEELARREQEESDQSGPWNIDTRGRHGSQPPNSFDWPTSGGTPTVINGIPPQPPDQHH